MKYFIEEKKTTHRKSLWRMGVWHSALKLQSITEPLNKYAVQLPPSIIIVWN